MKTPDISLPGPVIADLIRDSLALGNEIAFPVVSNSMKPLICKDDVITVKPCNISELAPGDVVVYTLEGALGTHRVLYTWPGRVQTKGDCNVTLDPVLARDHIIGRVVAIASVSRRRYLSLNGGWWRILRYLTCCCGRARVRWQQWSQHLDSLGLPRPALYPFYGIARLLRIIEYSVLRFQARVIARPMAESDQLAWADAPDQS